MLIRSSDGIHIVNLNCIDGVSVCYINGEITVRSFSSVDEVGLRLGTYDSKERAIEVLDEICKAYLDLNVDAINYGCDNGGYVKNGIYQMPEE